MGKIRYLFAAYVAFVIYGTLIPFHTVDSLQAVLRNVDAVRWLPFWDLHHGRIASIPDMIQNVLLFLPMGILGAHCFGRRLAPTLATGISLSLLVESLQILTLYRVSSVNDLVTNALGTAAGFLLYLRLAPFWPRMIDHPVMRNIARAPSALPLLLMLLYSWVYALEPFNLTLDAGIVWWNVQALIWQLVHPRMVIRDEFILASQFALIGFFAAGLLKQLGVRAARSRSLLLVLLWAVVTEMSQLIVVSRMASLLTLCFSWLGAALGVAARSWYALSPRPGRLFVLGSFAVDALSPFALRESYLHPALLPFRHYQSAYFVIALSNVFHALLVFMPLGYLAAHIRWGRIQNIRWGRIKIIRWGRIKIIRWGRIQRLLFWTVLLLACIAIELGQGFIIGRYPDVTDCLLPYAGAIIGWQVAHKVRESLK